MKSKSIIALIILLAVSAAEINGQTPTVSGSSEKEATAELFNKTAGSMTDFMLQLKSQDDISDYTSENISAQTSIELLALCRLEKKGHKLVGIEDHIKERLDCLVFFATHSHQSPRLAAMTVLNYLFNINILMKDIDHGLVADECVKLLREQQGSLIAVPLYYYAKYIGGKAVDEPKNIDADKLIHITCENTLKRKIR